MSVEVLQFAEISLGYVFSRDECQYIVFHIDNENRNSPLNKGLMNWEVYRSIPDSRCLFGCL